MSYSGTVRCSVCYERGHNKTSCPQLKDAWEKDPNSYYGREWQKILDRKARPKSCGYCQEAGHTRAQCELKKKHQSIYLQDLTLWRRALVKWVNEVGLGRGCLVRSYDVAYQAGNGHGWMYPNHENYAPPLSLTTQDELDPGLTHHSGIMNTNQWDESSIMVLAERVGISDETPPYRKRIAITLPCIPGIVPRYGQAYWGSENRDRLDRAQGTTWEVVSRGIPLKTDNFLKGANLRKVAKAHFSAKNDTWASGWRQFTDFQRDQLRKYVNGEIELSEMVDPEVPPNDS